MSLLQTLRCIRYRWKLFLLVFLLVFAFTFSVLAYVQSDRTEEIAPTRYVYRSYTVFEDDKESATRMHSVLQAMLFETATLEMLDGVRVNTKEEGDALVMSVEGEEERAVFLATKHLTDTFLARFSEHIPFLSYQSGTTLLEYRPPKVEVKTKSAADKILDLVYLILIPFSFALLCAVAMVFARENTDTTIRSRKQLVKATDARVLPLLTKDAREAEYVALGAQLQPGKAYTFASIAKGFSLEKMMEGLANACASEESSVALVNLTERACASHNKDVTVYDEYKAKSLAYYASPAFEEILQNLQQENRFVFVAAPSVADSGIAVSLTGGTELIYLLRFGKDHEEALKTATRYVSEKKEALYGVSGVGYRDDREDLV